MDVHEEYLINPHEQYFMDTHEEYLMDKEKICYALFTLCLSLHQMRSQFTFLQKQGNLSNLHFLRLKNYLFSFIKKADGSKVLYFTCHGLTT